VTSGLLIREARLLAGLSQGELGARVGKDRAQIARWERGAVEPSFETLRQLVRACGFELDVSISPVDVDEAGEKVLRRKLRMSPQERLRELLKASKT
jgi:transcriptional regulator with XRE-family HTH domain